MKKYQVLTPIKTLDGVVTEGYIEIPDNEVEALTACGAIGQPEAVAKPVAKPAPTPKGRAA